MSRSYYVTARPAGQAVPTLYAGRRYHAHHGGRLVPVRRQGLTWATRKGAEGWIERERMSWPESPVYGRMEYEVVEEDGRCEEEIERFTFRDAAGQVVAAPHGFAGGTAEIARATAQVNRLAVYACRYKLSAETLIADYTSATTGGRR